MAYERLSAAANRMPPGAVDVMRRAAELERAGRDIVHLEIGEPDFATPAHITDAAKAALDAGFTHYAPVPGLRELRELIGEAAARVRGLTTAYAPDDVVVGPGAKPLIWNVLAALLDPGDEIVFSDPAYPAYDAAAAYLGARAVTFRLRGDAGWRPDLDELTAAVGPRTKAIVLNSPHNPTGGILTRDDLAVVAELARRYDLIVISDEIYSRTVYDDACSSIAALPGMRERTVLIDGFSKSFAMTGWRLGYCIAPAPIARAMIAFANNTYQCVATFVQLGGLAALRGSEAEVVAMVARLKRRRDVVVGGLNAIPGVSCALPAGAFYAFPNVAAIEPDDAALAYHLLESAGVAVLGGSQFGPAGRGHLRLSYATATVNLERALARMHAALAAYPVAR